MRVLERRRQWCDRPTFDNLFNPAVEFLQSCDPHTDCLDHNLQNFASRQRDNRGRECSFVMPDGPGATPLLAERRFLANLSGSREKSSTGQCSIISLGISMMAVGWRARDLPTFSKLCFFPGMPHPPEHVRLPSSRMIGRLQLVWRDCRLADGALSADDVLNTLQGSCHLRRWRNIAATTLTTSNLAHIELGHADTPPPWPISNNF